MKTINSKIYSKSLPQGAKIPTQPTVALKASLKSFLSFSINLYFSMKSHLIKRKNTYKKDVLIGIFFDNIFYM